MDMVQSLLPRLPLQPIALMLQALKVKAVQAHLRPALQTRLRKRVSGRQCSQRRGRRQADGSDLVGIKDIAEQLVCAIQHGSVAHTV